jgi:hypothetical protein
VSSNPWAFQKPAQRGRDAHTAGRIWLAPPGLTIWRAAPLTRTRTHAGLHSLLLLHPDSALFASHPFQAAQSQGRQSSRWRHAGVEPRLTLPWHYLIPASTPVPLRKSGRKQARQVPDRRSANDMLALAPSHPEHPTLPTLKPGSSWHLLIFAMHAVAGTSGQVAASSPSPE